MEQHAEFQTRKARQCIASLRQRFARKVRVQNNGTSGQIELSFGTCALKTDETHLELSETASAQVDLDKTVEVITNQLERSAYRENPVNEFRLSLAGA